MGRDEAESSTPQSSVVSSVVVVDNRKKTEGPGKASRARYLEPVKDLDLEDLACRHEIVEVLEAHFSRAKTLKTADFTGIPKKSIMGPVNHRLLKEMGSPGLIVEPPKHRTSIARIRVAISAHLEVVEKLLEPKNMGLADTAYTGPKLAEDPRCF